ncbi:MAG: hypothetical protein ABSE95_06660 [Thermodesulfobacteriota bacterium]|jgi:hypothetical protein
MRCQKIVGKIKKAESHLLPMGKFLKVGQARKEGLASGKDFIKERYVEPGRE